MKLILRDPLKKITEIWWNNTKIFIEKNCIVEINKTIILWSTWKTDTNNLIKTKLLRNFNGELFEIKISWYTCKNDRNSLILLNNIWSCIGIKSQRYFNVEIFEIKISKSTKKNDWNISIRSNNASIFIGIELHRLF